MNTQGVVIDIKPGTTGPKRVSQIVLLLDDKANIVNVNRSLAGSRFASLSPNDSLHRQLHPRCEGDCQFAHLWETAWASLQERASVEWEVDDALLRRLLRLNLSRLPAARTAEPDRRKPYKILTITDVTRYRREYENLVRQQQALVDMLVAQDQAPGTEKSDDLSDTGNRLMAQLLSEDRSFARQLVLAQESERRRIAAELHDGVAQSVSALKFRLEGFAAQLGQNHPDVDVAMLDDVVGDLQGVLDEIRRISSNLVPSILDDFGLQVALDWLCREFSVRHPDIAVDCETGVDECDTPDVVKVAIYRMVQEALNNAAKHAAAGRISVSVVTTPDRSISVRISDDGSGFDPGAVESGPGETIKLGLRSMRERVETTGGEFDITSRAGQGVIISAEWSKEELDSIR